MSYHLSTAAAYAMLGFLSGAPDIIHGLCASPDIVYLPFKLKLDHLFNRDRI